MTAANVEGSRPWGAWSGRSYRSAARALLAALLAACTGPDLPDAATPLTPPFAYRGWWAMTEACSGLSGPFEAVRWYRAPARDIRAKEGGGTIAYWASHGNIILLADELLANGQAVRHEMLHALSKRRGHPRELFQERCGEVVVCEERCRTAGGG